MVLTKEARTAVVKKYQKHPTDTGSPLVQIALLTERISYLTDHLRTHKKDHHSQRGLLMAVSQRKRLLTYLKRTDYPKYTSALEQLKLRK